MLFNSFEFVLLVIITFLLYYLPIINKYQKVILIFSSFVFYAFNSPSLLILLFISILINVITSYLIEYGRLNQRRFYATLGILVNLGILAFFKYSPLFSITFFPQENSIGEFLVSIPLPIGISFFTFQGVSLLIDTYESDTIKEFQGMVKKNKYKHGLNTFLFISFFPQLVAGPIVKAHDFIPQINKKYFTKIDWEYCFRAIITGYFLKMVIADNLKEQTFWIEYPYFEGLPGSVLLSMLIGYSMQIFADFAGYSLIAIGISGLFGYRLKENFNFPYISKSFSEFWTRWHISLSSFLKEYLYIPLGGNRTGNLKTYLNLMVVMFLGGLWHGAAWSYAVWGSFHGVALAIERFFMRANLIKSNSPNFIIRKLNTIVIPSIILKDVIKILFIFSLVSLSWLLFKLPEFSYAVLYLKSIWNNGFIPYGNINFAIIGMTFLYSLPVIIYHAYYLMKKNEYFPSLVKKEYIAFGIMIFLIITNSGFAGSFIYFQF